MPFSSTSVRNVISTDRLLAIIAFVGLPLFVTLNSCANNNGSIVIDPDSIDTTTKRGGYGKMIFLEKCAPCHAIFKDLSGPSLSTVADLRDSAWIFKFLTNRKFVKEDSITKSFKRDFGFVCPVFPELTPENVGMILKYVKEAQHPHY